MEYVLGDDGLTVNTSATNATDVAAPFGIGFDPYLTVGTPTVDSARLVVPALRRLLADETACPPERSRSPAPRPTSPLGP